MSQRTIPRVAFLSENYPLTTCSCAGWPSISRTRFRSDAVTVITGPTGLKPGTKAVCT